MVTSTNHQNQNQSSSIKTTPKNTSSKINPDLARVHPKSDGNPNVIQRQILWEQLKSAFLDDFEIKSPDMSASNPLQQRNFEQTKMLFEEIQIRYPNAVPEEKVNLLKQIAQKSPNLNKNTILTYTDICNAITKVQFSGAPPAVMIPEQNPQKFIKFLTDRRGAYNWEGGIEGDFKKWLTQPEPLKIKLPIDAKICCWEAIFYSAAQTNLLNIEQLREAYAAKNPIEAIYWMLINGRELKAIIRNPEPTKPENNLQTGDIIMANGKELSHVMVVVEEEPTDYNKVKVLSLWVENVFLKTNLGNVLNKMDGANGKPVSIEYVTLQ